MEAHLMENKTKARFVWGAVFTLLIGACEIEESDNSADSSLMDGTTRYIIHQNQDFVADVLPDGSLIVEGDIVVYPGHYTELDELEDTSVDVTRQPLSIVGHSYRWKKGIVYYVDPAKTGFPGRPAAGIPRKPSVVYADDIIDAMGDIERLAPGVRFVERTTTPSYLVFADHGRCSSPVGKQGGPQIISLTSGCTNFTIHHEIFHSLGIWHTQSRNDRVAAGVRINWQNICGCPRNATRADHCGDCSHPNNPGCSPVCDSDSVAHNFRKHRYDGKIIGPYDYDSIMHYPRNAFGNGMGDTITATFDPAYPAVGNPAKIGQRSAFSENDGVILQALYPVLGTHHTFFADTGRQPNGVVSKIQTIVTWQDSVTNAVIILESGDQCWFDTAAPNGKTLLSMAMGAQLANQTVRVWCWDKTDDIVGIQSHWLHRFQLEK